jgi:hypothetical protein
MRATFTTGILFLCGTLAACGDNEEEEANEEATASALVNKLTGSTFEIDDDANLVVNVMGNNDWISVSDSKTNDLPTGQNDDSYSGGGKEDDLCPSVGTGSIPNNKSDLKTFAVYVEPGTSAGDPGYLHVAWSRVQDPTGTTLMDFEFNQNKTKCGNGVNPIRTVGDFLIEYKLENGGTRATIVLRTWDGSAWGGETDLSAANKAIGTINTTAITSGNSDGFGALSPRTFGEASVDLDLIFNAGSCQSFGSAFVKSRSSVPFTAALKDFIRPIDIALSNCGKVIIRKETVPDALTDQFTFTHNLLTDPVQMSSTFQLADGGNKEFANVLIGTGYTVTETIPSNYSLSINCSASTGVTPTTDNGTGQVGFAIDSPSDIVDCTYTNTRNTGSILITKTRKHAATGSGDYPHVGVNFTVNGQTVTTNALGQACIDGLPFATYAVTETVPTGYVADGGATKNATVTQVGSCTDGIANEATVAFSNTPLTNLTVSVDSQVAGGTASTIQCVPGNAQPVATGSGGDGSTTLSDLLPGTYVCTVIIDP